MCEREQTQKKVSNGIYVSQSKVIAPLNITSPEVWKAVLMKRLHGIWKNSKSFGVLKFEGLIVEFWTSRVALMNWKSVMTNIKMAVPSREMLDE